MLSPKPKSHIPVGENLYVNDFRTSLQLLISNQNCCLTPLIIQYCQRTYRVKFQTRRNPMRIIGHNLNGIVKQIRHTCGSCKAQNYSLTCHFCHPQCFKYGKLDLIQSICQSSRAYVTNSSSSTCSSEFRSLSLGVTIYTPFKHITRTILITKFAHYPCTIHTGYA